MTQAVEIEGEKELVAAMKKAMTLFPKFLGKELYQEGERIMTDSKANYAPVDLGTLRSSGFVQQPVFNKTSAEVTLGYGGAAASYAVIQHENMSYRHTVGGPKYLERPVLHAKKSMSNRIGKSAFR